MGCYLLAFIKRLLIMHCVVYARIHVGGHEVGVQYSNWQSGYPVATSSDHCVVVTGNNKWLPFSCNTPQKYVCQS